METSALLRIGLIQMQAEKGAVDDNIRVMGEYLARARENCIDIVCFPEMCITGYADPTRYAGAVIRMEGPELEKVLRLTIDHPSIVLAGFIEENKIGDNAYRKPYITQVVMRNGTCMGYYRKVTIKDDEVNWFSAGDVVPVFQHESLTYGIAICADISNEWVFAECARQGAKIVFELAAPGLYGEQATRNWQSGFAWWRGECFEKLGSYAKKYHIWIAVATQAGRTVDEDFPGGGYLFSPNGECLYQTQDWHPGAVFLEIDLETAKVTQLFI